MVITERRLQVEEQVEEQVAISDLDLKLDDRSRDANGHCWDGRSCDHLDHGSEGTIHFIR